MFEESSQLAKEETTTPRPKSVLIALGRRMSEEVRYREAKGVVWGPAQDQQHQYAAKKAGESAPSSNQAAAASKKKMDDAAPPPSRDE
jgi:hypothetical protein